MSDPNLKAMTQAELLKYLDEDFMPRLLPKLANIKNLEDENASLKDEVEQLTGLLKSATYYNQSEEVERLKAEVERLQNELKFSEHRMISLAEALADTRLGYQKKIEILKEGRINRKRDQEALKKANQGQPSRPGVDGKIVRNKPSKGRGTY